jgi:hypothetical protein
MGAGPDAASNMTVTRLRSSQKLAVDTPDANTRVTTGTEVLTSQQEGIPGGILREGVHRRAFYCQMFKRFASCKSLIFAFFFLSKSKLTALELLCVFPDLLSCALLISAHTVLTLAISGWCKRLFSGRTSLRLRDIHRIRRG